MSLTGQCKQCLEWYDLTQNEACPQCGHGEVDDDSIIVGRNQWEVPSLFDDGESEEA